MRELFVYYRVRADGIGAAREAVLLMQRELRATFPELEARLLTRAEGTGSATWMETYAAPTASAGSGIDAQIEAAIATRAHALQAFIEGPRHVEIFDSGVGR
jgi:hypothetical protein